MFPARLIFLIVVALGFALFGPSRDGTVAAHAAGPETLPAAQTRLRYAQEAWEATQTEVKRQEQRLKDAEASLTRQEKRVEDEKGRVEQSRNSLLDAKTRADEAKRKYDEAYAEIQALYKERQQAPSPANVPSDTLKPRTN